jgi:hypothetical protein
MRQKIVFSASKKEVDELRKALDVLKKWRRRAMIVAQHKESTADWTMVDFSFEGKDVAIDVQAGSCG